MRWLVAVGSSFILAAIAIGGCGLDGDAITALELENDAGIPTSDGAPAGDATFSSDAKAIADAQTKDVVEEPPPAACTIAPGTCVNALPTGWSLTTYSGSRTAACGTSYSSTDVVSDPDAGAGACSCSCTVNTPPVCDHGSLTRMISADNSCGTTGVTLTVNGAGCTAWASDSSGPLLANSKASPLPASGGACTGTPTTNVGAVTTVAGRICAPPTDCEEQLCNGTSAVPAGYGLCISKPDIEVTCPTGWGTSPIIVGDAVGLACSACTCDVNDPSTCTAATLAIFSDPGCGTSIANLNIDGSCDPDPGAGKTPAAFKYAATLTQACTTAGLKTPTASVTNAQSICCKP